MTLTIEIPDIRIDDVRASAQAQGQDLGTFATAAVLAAVDNIQEPDLESVIEEAAHLYDSGERGIPLEEAFTAIRARFAERA